MQKPELKFMMLVNMSMDVNKLTLTSLLLGVFKNLYINYLKLYVLIIENIFISSLKIFQAAILLWKKHIWNNSIYNLPRIQFYIVQNLEICHRDESASIEIRTVRAWKSPQLFTINIKELKREKKSP